MTDKETAILEAINKDYTVLYPGEEYEISVSDIVEYTKKKIIENVCKWLSDCHFLPSDGYYCDGKLIAEELREELGMDKHEDNRNNDQ